MAGNEQKVSIMSHFDTEDKVAAGGQSTKVAPRTSMVGIKQEITEETDTHEEDEIACLQAAKQFEQEQNEGRVNVDMNSLDDAEKKAAVEAVVKYRAEKEKAELKRKNENLQRAKKIKKLRTQQSALLDIRTGLENRLQTVLEDEAKNEAELQRELKQLPEQK